MNNLLDQITDRIHSAPNNSGFLNHLFGGTNRDAIHNASIVLYGAGSLGQELCVALNNHGVYPKCFCDTSEQKIGTIFCGIPVVGLDELSALHRDSLIIVATKIHATSVTQTLLDLGFTDEQILCNKADFPTYLVFLYANAITQIYTSGLRNEHTTKTILDKFKSDEPQLKVAYDLFADQKSKDLFITKLAFIASSDNLGLFADFITDFSEPYLQYGFDNHIAPTEDFYYFNNDVLRLSENEIYVDVGAFDGDTIQTFVQACEASATPYRHIYAFEPDPVCFQLMLKNTGMYGNVSCHHMGLWSESGTLKFRTSEQSVHDQAASISGSGDLEIPVMALDDFMEGDPVTFIKMDPGGNVIPSVIKGAIRTIATHRPKLAIGAYHAIESIYEIPFLVHSICPDYKLYLRHNTYHPCDTVLYAL